VLAGWSRSIGENLSLNISAGPRLAFTKSAGTGSAQDAVLGADIDAVLSYRVSERTSLAFNAGQSLEPSSNGIVQERQRLSFAVDHRLSQKAQFSLSGSFQRNGSGLTSNRQPGGEQRLFFATTANASYQFSPTLAASARYFFRTQRLGEAGSWAFSHGFAIVLTYSPRGWSFRN
jgi:hypothetical protein